MTDAAKLPGMKEKEFIENAVCSQCKKRVMEANPMMFYRLTLETWIPDHNAMQRQIGLGMHLGGHHQIASAFGPNEDMAKQMSEVRIPVCMDCMSSSRIPLVMFEGIE
jgi:hypothetical protein